MDFDSLMQMVEKGLYDYNQLFDCKTFCYYNKECLNELDYNFSKYDDYNWPHQKLFRHLCQFGYDSYPLIESKFYFSNSLDLEIVVAFFHRSYQHPSTIFTGSFGGYGYDIGNTLSTEAKIRFLQECYAVWKIDILFLMFFQLKNAIAIDEGDVQIVDAVVKFPGIHKNTNLDLERFSFCLQNRQNKLSRCDEELMFENLAKIRDLFVVEKK